MEENSSTTLFNNGCWIKEYVSRHPHAPHTPEQNGVSERANRTIVEGARSLLHAKRLPLEL